MTDFNDMVDAMASHKGDFVVLTKKASDANFEEVITTTDIDVAGLILNVVGTLNIEWNFDGNSMLFWIS